MKNFRKIPRGIDELLTSDGVKKHELQYAEEAAAVTRSLVPSIDKHTVRTKTTDEGVAVVVDSGRWHWWEYGNVKVRARAPLRRGLESTGVKIVR